MKNQGKIIFANGDKECDFENILFNKQEPFQFRPMSKNFFTAANNETKIVCKKIFDSYLLSDTDLEIFSTLFERVELISNKNWTEKKSTAKLVLLTS